MKKIIYIFAFIIPILCNAAVTITPATLPSGYIQHPYSQALTATGGSKPYAWSISAGTLPTGLTLLSGSQPNATLSGTPTVAGVYTFTVQAVATSGGTGTTAYTVTITQIVLSASQITTIWNRGVPDYANNWDTWNSLSGATANGWSITGNSGTTAGTNFVGTTDAVDLVFKRNSSEGLRIYSSSNFIGVGTAAPAYLFEVARSDAAVQIYNTTAASSTDLYLKVKSTTGIAKTFTIRNDATANDTLGQLYFTRGNSAQAAMVVSGLGGVGIGSVAPVAELEVTAPSSYSVAVKATSYTTTATSYVFRGFNSASTNILSARADGQLSTTYSVSASAGDAATLNAASGYFTKDASGTTFTLTNSLVTAASIIMLQFGTVGLTAGNNAVVVPGAGSAVITFQSAAGAAEAPNANAIVNFWIVN